MSRNTKSRLMRAIRDIQASFVTESMMVNILSVRGSEKTLAKQFFGTIREKYILFLTTNGYINCGIDGVPNQFAREALEKIGITEASLRADLKSIEEYETESMKR